MAAPIRKRRFRSSATGAGLVADPRRRRRRGTAVAVEHGEPGIYNIVTTTRRRTGVAAGVASALHAKPPRADPSLAGAARSR